MNIKAEIDSQLLQRNLLPLTEDQVSCLQDPHRLEEAIGMLEDLRDRCGVRLPLPQGIPLAGPLETLDDARAEAEKHLRGHPVVAVDEMATDDSRSSGVGNEFYVTAFNGPDAALALVDADHLAAYWVQGIEQESE